MSSNVTLVTACVTNAFILHRRHLDFIRQWKCQIAKVIAPANTGVVDRRSRPYFMIDESVLSSLLVFSAIAPPVAPYARIRTFGGDLLRRWS
jgi:hypothetical protein